MLPLTLLVGSPAHYVRQNIQFVGADTLVVIVVCSSNLRAKVFAMSAAWSSGKILAQGARSPGFNSRSSPMTSHAMQTHPCRPASLPAIRTRMRVKDTENEGREIRTPNLLTWSRTRYRCAIPSLLSLPSSGSWAQCRRESSLGHSGETKGAALGVEPRTSRTRSENHTTRPSSRWNE